MTREVVAAFLDEQKAAEDVEEADVEERLSKKVVELKKKKATASSADPTKEIYLLVFHVAHSSRCLEIQPSWNLGGTRRSNGRS